MNTTLEAVGTPAGARVRVDAAAENVRRHLLTLLQLGLAAVVVNLYSVEGRAFRDLLLLASAGFAVNLVLPKAVRLPFFVGLSVVGIFVVFSPVDGLWMIATGLALIGICHIPVAFRIRASFLVLAGCVLAAARAGQLPSPWSPAVWPVLGSMFMFRLVLYMLAAKKGRPEGGLWAGVAYFFMLPNLVFPLFPVIDYQTFRRTHYDQPDWTIHQRGLLWISRGLVHLLLYRFVYHSVLNDPVDVLRLSDLIQFMLGTFLLYLRVSGQFHLIVGILHLFGFRLPETHKLYYLAHSFTELWRRINIYWTDFMMKTVFYPVYFKAKGSSPTVALVVATGAVFLTTWILHSYQWFWLRGGFPITLQDGLFWAILGILVIAAALRELKSVRKPRQTRSGWSLRSGLQTVGVFSLFCLLWSLWSTDSVSQWVWMLGAAANVDTGGLLLGAGVVAILLTLGGWNWEQRASYGLWLQPSTRTTVVLLALSVLGLPATRAVMPEPVAGIVHAFAATGLNARDAAVQHRGYYEQLEIRGQQRNDRLLEVIDRQGAEWHDPASLGIIRERKDLLLRDLKPSVRTVWNGNVFTTNSWGMRDQEYSVSKPPGTLRIALLGPSHVMGNGVSDQETFEALVEARLNRELPIEGYTRFEVLNFAVDGFTLPQQVALLEDRVFAFSPDVVLVTINHEARKSVENYIGRIVWGGIPAPDAAVQDMISRAGLVALDRGTLPIPFAGGRAIARRLGLNPRMPHGESAARARWISEEMLSWSFQKVVRLCATHEAIPAVLALNAVNDEAPTVVPNQEIIRQHRLPLIDLFDIYPSAARESLRVASWDNHPNAMGHRLIADALYPKLVNLLRSERLARGGGN